MPTRRRFLRSLPAAALAAPTLPGAAVAKTPPDAARPDAARLTDGRLAPATVISTWPHGLPANEEAMRRLSSGGSALDAVEAGVRVPEADPEVRTVGRGAYPDREGRISLDASVMRGNGECGSVAALCDILHPISVARAVMEDTPHVMLVGRGAYDFARSRGHEHTDLHTDRSRREYATWLRENGPARPAINIENHDTIGLLALDAAGGLAGACTTSGAAYKYAGRGGDSPIIGAGLYVDGEVGAATATGWGEAVIRACGSFLVVELMRQGLSPQAACEAAVERVVGKNPDWREIQVGFIALGRDGEVGAFCIAPGFSYAVHDATGARLLDAPSKL